VLPTKQILTFHIHVRKFFSHRANAEKNSHIGKTVRNGEEFSHNGKAKKSWENGRKMGEIEKNCLV